MGSQNSLPNLMKHFLLIGAEILFMSRNRLLSVSDFDFKNGKFKGKTASKQTKEVCGWYENHAIQTSSSSSSNYNFPLNFIVFLTVLVSKLAGSQITLCLRFLTFPIWCVNLCLMLMMFPFQTLTQTQKRLQRSCNACYLGLISFMCNSLKSQNSSLRLAVRSSKAFFCAVYVFFVLSALLVSAFVIGGVVMTNLVQESIQSSEPLNFDYTKTSPVAVVPVASNCVLGQRLQVTVSLALPESEYNRNLGSFQVRVEGISGNGEVIYGRSYPAMLGFKSGAVRAIETLFNFVPLITGLKSQVQTVKIVMGEYEATAFLKVVLVQRAEFGNGSGVPEIYGASMEIASKQPQLKKIMWSWRRTLFVWVSFVSFVVETMILLIFCRAVILPGGRSNEDAGSCKKDPMKMRGGCSKKI